MSQENVEVVREAIAAWNAGDMERLRDVYDPGAIARPLRDWPEGGEPGIGRDAIMRQFRQMRETWDSDDVLDVLGDIVTAGDRVVVRFAWKGAGRGPPMNLEVTYVYTVRKGRVFEVEAFWDHDDALEAIGLQK